MGTEIPTRAGDWHVDWAVRSTWTRLTLAILGLSLGVASAVLAADFVDVIVIDLVARTGISDGRDYPFAVDVTRMIVMFVTITSILAALIQGFAKVMSYFPGFDSPKDSVEVLEQNTVKKVWNYVDMVMLSWAFSLIYIVENTLPSINIFADSYKWMVFFVLMFSWIHKIEPMFLTLLRNVLAQRVSTDTVTVSGAPIGPVGLARIYLVVATAVTVAAYGLAAVLMPSG